MVRQSLARGHFVDLGTFAPGRWPERPVTAYVPSTARHDTPHPLLMLFDGQNIFEDHGSYAGGWHVHDCVDAMTASTVAAPIIVGIHNGGTARISEMGAGLRPFLDAVVGDVLPRVLCRFSIGGPEHRVIGGSSLGGLAALHMVVEHPQAFQGAMAMSPSLWFGRKKLLRSLESGERALHGRGRVYLDVGRRESELMVADAARLAGVLALQGFQGDRLMWRPDARGTHNERHWRRRLPKALRFLFRRR